MTAIGQKRPVEQHADLTFKSNSLDRPPRVSSRHSISRKANVVPAEGDTLPALVLSGPKPKPMQCVIELHLHREVIAPTGTVAIKIGVQQEPGALL